MRIKISKQTVTPHYSNDFEKEREYCQQIKRRQGFNVFAYSSWNLIHEFWKSLPENNDPGVIVLDYDSYSEMKLDLNQVNLNRFVPPPYNNYTVGQILLGFNIMSLIRFHHDIPKYKDIKYPVNYLKVEQGLPASYYEEVFSGRCLVHINHLQYQLLQRLIRFNGWMWFWFTMAQIYNEIFHVPNLIIEKRLFRLGNFNFSQEYSQRKHRDDSHITINLLADLINKIPDKDPILSQIQSFISSNS